MGLDKELFDSDLFGFSFELTEDLTQFGSDALRQVDGQACSETHPDDFCIFLSFGSLFVGFLFVEGHLVNAGEDLFQ